MRGSRIVKLENGTKIYVGGLQGTYLSAYWYNTSFTVLPCLFPFSERQKKLTYRQGV